MKVALASAEQAVEAGRRILFGSELYGEIIEFLHEEAEFLDELRFDEWAKVLAEDIRYTMPMRVTRTFAERDKSVVRGMMHFDDDYLSLMARLGRLETTSAWAEDPPSRTRRLITNVRVRTTPKEGEYAVKNYLLLSRNRYEQSQPILMSAVRRDVIRRVGGGFQLAARDIVIDQSVLGMPNLAVFL